MRSASFYVDEAVKEIDLSELAEVSIDETSCRRGHDYITLVADARKRRVVFVTEGKDAATIRAALTRRRPRAH